MSFPFSQKTFWVSVVILLFLGGALLFQEYKLLFFDTTQVVFFDLPGESMLIIGKNGEKILIDTGEGKQTAEHLLSIFPFWARTIDGLFLTHFDADHLGGAESILRHFEVGAIFVNGSIPSSNMAQKTLQIVQEKNIPLLSLNAERDIKIGSLTVDIAFPRTSAIAKEASGNVFSLAGRLSLDTHTTLFFTGDIEKPAEKIILFSPQKIKSNILKVAHHGSKTSSTGDFLRAGAFQQAVIVAQEKNQYGFPHSEVISRFSQLHIPVFQTGKQGDISLSLP